MKGMDDKKFRLQNPLFLFKIAYRNIFRNKRRSLLSITAICFAVFMIIGVMAFLGGMKVAIRKAVLTFEVGHISITTKDFENNIDFLPLQYPVEYKKGNLNDMIDAIKKIDGVREVFPRMMTGATLTNNVVKHAVLWGIDIDREKKYHEFNLRFHTDGIFAGRFPEPGKNECAICLRLAMKMSLIPQKIEPNEYRWIIDNTASQDGEKFLGHFYNKDAGSKYYSLRKNLVKADEFKLLGFFINAEMNTIPSVIGKSSNVVFSIFQNALYKGFFLDNYDYDGANDTYILKKNIGPDDRDFLLEIFRDESELRIPLKIISSKYSDKYYAPKISGIFDFDYAIVDKHYIIIPFKKFQKLANLENQTQSLFVYLDNINKTDSVKKKITRMLDNNDLSIKGWNEFPLVVFFRAMDVYMMIAYIIFIILSSFLIINVIIMVIYERIKEIGMMGALGLKRSEIVAVFFLEAVVLSFIGSLAGTVAGGIMTFIFSLFPINYDALMGGLEFQYSNTIFVQFSFGILSFGFLFGFILSSICTIFPSLKTAFIEPVEALRR